MDRRFLGAPWLAIWIDPRATIREIAATNPRRGMHGIAAAAGALGFLAASLLARAHMSVLFSPKVVMVGTIAAAPVGIALLYVEAFLYLVIGWALGGSAAIAQVRAAVAWSWVPLIWLCLIAVPILRLARVFRVVFESGQIALVHTQAGQFLAAITWIVFAWGFVISAKCIAEVHGFSAWKGAGAKLITGAAMAVGALASICVLAVAFEVAHALHRML